MQRARDNTTEEPTPKYAKYPGTQVVAQYIPTDIVSLIAACLPMQDVANMRLVSKAFNDGALNCMMLRFSIDAFIPRFNQFIQIVKAISNGTPPSSSLYTLILNLEMAKIYLERISEAPFFTMREFRIVLNDLKLRAETQVILGKILKATFHVDGASNFSAFC